MASDELDLLRKMEARLLREYEAAEAEDMPDYLHKWDDWRAVYSAIETIDKLPTTADGVPVVPGMTEVYFRDVYDKEWVCDTAEVTVYHSFYDDITIIQGEQFSEHCYSTESAARAAKEAQDA